MDHQSLLLQTASLSVLRRLQHTSIYERYRSVLSALSKNIEVFADAYSALCAYQYQAGDLGGEIVRAVQFDENALTAAVSTADPAVYVLDAATRDLRILDALIALDSTALQDAACRAFPASAAFIAGLPVFSAGTLLPFADGAALLRFYRTNGFGFFAQSTAYTIGDQGQAIPVPHADGTRLTDLKGYALQKKTIIDNTLSFLSGQNANNILLYGDKGTGKSSTVKAVVNEYADKGLKIIELPLRRIGFFPQICDAVAQSPYKFIVFLDDLTFHKEDDNFAALKAFIEGGLAGKPSNLILYATSNRRHLVREGFSDRDGDEIHMRDTMETITSLSDRFGIEITFSIPGKDDYLSIVEQLAAEQNITLPTRELHILAERFALRKNGRSPRTARQFISFQLAQANNGFPAQNRSSTKDLS